MELNLNLNYKKLPKDADGRDTKATDLTRLILTRSVDTKYSDGKMPSGDSRMWAKMQDMFSDETDTIEIDGSQFDWLKDVVDKTDLPAAFSSWLWVVRNHFDSMKNESKDQKKDKDRKIGAVQ